MISYALLFITGFLGSFGHCVGMCGGFVFTYSLSLAEAKGADVCSRILPHLSYNLGRVYTYALLGGLAGAFGHLIALSSRTVAVRALVPILAGAAMVVLGLARLGLILRLQAVQGPIPIGRWVRFLGGLVRGRSLSHLFAFGLFNGFLPCGLSYTVALAAVGAGSFAKGFLTMAVFGLGTIPAMFALGASSSAVGGHLRGPVLRVAAALVVALGVLSIVRGFGLAGHLTALHRCCSPYL